MRFFTDHKPIVFLVLASFLISGAYSFYFQIPPLVDARAYDRIAWNVAQGLGYREDVSVPIEKDNSIIRVGPGYELFLAAIFYLFGHHYWPVWIIQAMLLALIALLVYFISQRVFGRDWSLLVGLAAAALIGFSPDLITVSAMLLTEILALFLAVSTVYLFFRYLETPHLVWLLALSVVLGAAIMVRTPFVFLGIPVGAYILWRRRWAHALVMCVVVLVMFAPWVIRNFSVYHEFIPTNAASGFNLYAGNHVGASGEQESSEELGRYAEEFGYLAANRKATNEAKQFIFDQPFEYLKLTALRTSIYFSFARPTGFWFHLSGVSKLATLALSTVYAVLLFTLGFFGIAKIKQLSSDNRARAWYLLAMLIMMPLAIVGIIVETRYRFLSYPFFALFAGYGLSQLRKEGACRLCFFGVFFILFSNTAFDILRNLSRIFERIKGL